MRAPRHLGMPGHFIGSNRCVWHMTTIVGPYLVSTVGDWRPFDGNAKPEQIGVDRLYETMVFMAGTPCARPECMCGVPSHDDMSIDFAGYNMAGDAQAGHEKMVKKWALQANGKRGVK